MAWRITATLNPKPKLRGGAHVPEGCEASVNGGTQKSWTRGGSAPQLRYSGYKHPTFEYGQSRCTGRVASSGMAGSVSPGVDSAAKGTTLFGLPGTRTRACLRRRGLWRLTFPTASVGSRSWPTSNSRILCNNVAADIN